MFTKPTLVCDVTKLAMPCPINLEGSAKNIKITLHHHEVAHSLYLCLSREATVAPEVGGKAILTREYGTEENYPFKENRKSWTMKHLSCSPFSSHQNCVYRDRIIRKVGLRLETFRMPGGNLSNNHSASCLIYLYSSCEKNTQVGKKEWEREEIAPPKIKTATTNRIFYFWLNLRVQ